MPVGVVRAALTGLICFVASQCKVARGRHIPALVSNAALEPSKNDGTTSGAGDGRCLALSYKLTQDY